MPPQAATLDSLPDWQPPDQPPESAPTNVQPAATVDPRTGRPMVQVYRQNPSLQDLPEWQPPPPQEPARQVGFGEAVGTGTKQGLTFGFEPEYQGMSEAGNEVLKRMVPDEAAKYLQYVPSPIKAHIGAAVRLAEWASNHDDPEVAAAAERGRKFAQETVDLSKEQHPWGFYGGMIGGSLMLPGFGPEFAAGRAAAAAARTAAGPGTAVVRAAGAPLGERIASGVAQGGIYGGLQGTGEAVSEGKSAPEVAARAVKGGLFGAGAGGVLHGAVGPREAPMVPTGGQRAAATAEDLVGRPILPRGYASDKPIVRSATAKFESAPIAGPVIRSKVEEISGGAHSRVKDISEQMTGGAGERAASEPEVRSGLEYVRSSNKAAQDAAYKKLRSFLPGQGGGNPSASVHAMPRTKAVLDKIAIERAEAGEDPKAGLEAFHKIVNGTTFNGAQRARSQASNPNLATKTNVGYSGGDYKRIMTAMDGDLKQMVVEGAQANAKDPRAALRAFEEADAKFGPLKDQNDKIENLLASGGESVLAQLIAKGSEKSGDLRTLHELKQAMPPDAFAHIGGTILRELGMQSTAAGRQFSPRTFATGWDNMSKGAKAALFDPAHRQNIDEIIHMVRHIGAGMKDVNVSKTAGAFWGVEMVSKVGEVAIAAMGGLISPMTALKSTATLFVPDALGFILASPARTASTRSWLASYRAMVDAPTPARTAVFKIATRNLGKNIGLDPVVLMKSIESQVQGRLPGKAEDEPADQKK